MTYTLIIKTYWYSLKLINYFIHLVQIVIIYSMLCSVGLAAEQISSYVKECYKMDGDPDGQISTYSRVIDAGQIANKHDFSLAYHMRALGYARKNDITKALSDIDRAIEIEPEYFAHYLNRANFLDALGKHDRAIEEYNNSIKLNEKCVDCYYNRGVSLGQHNDIDGAVINFKKAIELSPNNLPARIAMARKAEGGLNK